MAGKNPETEFETQEPTSTDEQSAELESVNTEPETATETQAPDIPALEAAVSEAKATLTNREGEFKAAAGEGEIAKMLAAAEAVKTAQRAVDRATREYQAATWEFRAAERDAQADELKAAIELALEEIRADTMRELGITGLGVIFADGVATVTVQKLGSKPVTSGKRSATRKPAGDTRSRSLWEFGGENFTSRELLERFGGEDGKKAIDKADNWKAHGLKFSPGFDTPVKKLAKSMGWDEDTDTRVLTHMPS